MKIFLLSFILFLIPAVGLAQEQDYPKSRECVLESMVDVFANPPADVVQVVGQVYGDCAEIVSKEIKSRNREDVLMFIYGAVSQVVYESFVYCMPTCIDRELRQL